jgi:hypothetical protein
MVIYQDWAFEFLENDDYTPRSGLWFLRIFIMNLRNHLDNHQRSVLVSNSGLTWVPTSVKWLSERRDIYPPVNSLRVCIYTLLWSRFFHKNRGFFWGFWNNWNRQFFDSERFKEPPNTDWSKLQTKVTLQLEIYPSFWEANGVGSAFVVSREIPSWFGDRQS